MTFRSELLDELLNRYKNPEDLLGEGGILKQMTQNEAALVLVVDSHGATQPRAEGHLHRLHRWTNWLC